MNTLAVRILMVLGVILAGLAAFEYVQGLRAELKASKQAEQIARQGIADRDDIIKQLREDAKENDKARAKLEGDRNDIRSNLATRELMIREFQNEIKELRDWSAVRLPGVVIGMRDHPALTGAAAYRERMRNSDALHAAGGSGKE